MRRVKAWAQLVGGAILTLTGIVSAVNYSFDFELFSIPPGVIFAGLLILVGGFIFASGLVNLDSPGVSEDRKGKNWESGPPNP